MGDIYEQVYGNLKINMSEDEARDVARIIMWATRGSFYRAVAVTELIMRAGEQRANYARLTVEQVDMLESEE